MWNVADRRFERKYESPEQATEREDTVSELPNLPQREPGTHLPAAVKAVGRATVPQPGDRWYVDEHVLTVLLNNLRAWQVEEVAS